jgi:hypothetical protein
MRWVEKPMGEHCLVDDISEEIMAKVRFSFGHWYIVDTNREFLTLDAAKAAVEKTVTGYIVPQQSPR